jgi:hypothetical protein
MLAYPRHKLVFAKRLLPSTARAAFSSTSRSRASPEFIAKPDPSLLESHNDPELRNSLHHHHPAGVFGQPTLKKTWLPSGGMTTAEEKKGMRIYELF